MQRGRTTHQAQMVSHCQEEQTQVTSVSFLAIEFGVYMTVASAIPMQLAENA